MFSDPDRALRYSKIRLPSRKTDQEGHGSNWELHDEDQCPINTIMNNWMNIRDQDGVAIGEDAAAANIGSFTLIGAGHYRQSKAGGDGLKTNVQMYWSITS
jgi:hypothetical protein